MRTASTAWSAAALISAALFLTCPAKAQATLSLTPLLPTQSNTSGSSVYTITYAPASVSITGKFAGVTRTATFSIHAPGDITTTGNLPDGTVGIQPAVFTLNTSYSGSQWSSYVYPLENPTNGDTCIKDNLPSSTCTLTKMGIIPNGQSLYGVVLNVSLLFDEPNPTTTSGFRFRFTWSASGCLNADVSPSSSGLLQAPLAAGPTCPTSGIKIDHFEAVQVIQSADGTAVPLIAGKKTLLRAFVKSTGTDVIPIQTITPASFLSGYGINQQNFARSTLRDRSDMFASVNLRYDSPPAGTVTATVGINTSSLQTPPPPSVTGSVDIKFVPQKNPNFFVIGYMPVCFDGFIQQCVDPAILSGLTMDQYFPFPDGTFQFFQIPIPKPLVFHMTADGNGYVSQDFELQLSRILFKYFILLNAFPVDFLPRINRVDHLAAFTPLVLANGDISRYDNFAQLAHFPRYISWQPPPPGSTALDLSYSAELAHNLGHQFGLKDELPGSTREVGFDSNTRSLKLPTDPKLMESNYDPRRWITTSEYNAVLQNFAQPPATVAAAALQPNIALAAGASAEYAVVSGTVQLDGSGAQIDPVYRITTSQSQTPSNPAGNHCLQFRGASGALGQYCFDLDVTPTGVARLDQQMFAVAAPWPAGTTQLTLAQNGKTLQTLTAGRDPVVTILSPKSGDRWQGTNSISWSVAGAGSGVVYNVLYSPDAGTSWLPMAADITDTQFSFDAAKIMGGAQVYFRVMAASGLNSGSATVGPIQVAQTPKIGSTLPALDFGNTIAGQAASASIGITSAGSGPLTVTGYSVDNSAFTVISALPVGPVMSGSSRNVTVIFQGSAGTSQKGTLTVQSNDPLTPAFKIPLTASAFTTPQPSIATAPAAIDFGSVPVGQTGEAILPLANSGSADLNVSAIASSSSQFTIVSPTAPLTVSNGIPQDGVARFTPSAAGAQSGNITIASTDPTHASTVVKVQGTAVAASGTSPQIKAGGVVNGASFQGALARGGLGALFGSNFTASGATAQAATLPLPLSLLGVSLTVGGIPAPLIYLGANQINFQVPVEVSAGALAAVVVTVNGVPSPAVVARMADYALGVFQYARTATAIDPIIVHGATNQLITPSSPALPNETVVVYATGAGKLDNLPVTGSGALSSPISQALDTPTAALGGQAAPVLFAGLTPGLVGLIQLNIQLPNSISSNSNSLPLTIQFPGDAQVSVNLAVKGNVTAASPKLGLTAASLPFGGVTVGQTKDLTVTVSNTGAAALSGTASVTGAGFSLVSGSTIQVAANGAPQTITVRYAPTAAIAGAGTLTISSNDAASPALVSLSGNGLAAPAAGIIITPPALTFDNVPVNQTKDLVLQVNNNGTATLNVTGFASSNPRFTMLNPGVPFPVGAKSFQYVTVRFSPTAATAQSGVLTFTSNDPTSPTTVAVSGTVIAPPAPAIGILPATLDFVTVPANLTKDLVLQVNNNGDARLTVSGFASSNPRFTMLNPGLPFDVGAKSFQYVTVRFSPTNATAQSGVLTFTSNDPTSPTTVAVSGNSSGGTAANGCVAAPPNQLTWLTGDGNANDSAGPNNGTVLGGTTFVAGEVGQAFQFNGSTGYVSLGNPASLLLTSGITLEAWVNPVAAPATGTLLAIVTKWGQVGTAAANADSYGLWLELLNGHAALFTAVNTATGEPHVDGGTIPLNTWSHVAMTFNAASGALVVYVNGTAVGNFTFPGAILATNRNVLIGREDSFLPRAFNGGIDEVGIYGRALTAAEIQSIAAAGARGKCK